MTEGQGYELESAPLTGTDKKVPAVGSAAYETYKKLRNFELEMQSDMRMLN